MKYLFIEDRQKWERTIDAISEDEVTSSEKLLASHLIDVIDWFSEQAKEDHDLWGSAVRVAPKVLRSHTGLNKRTVERILKRWNECGLVTKKNEPYRDREGGWHSRMYLEVSERFMQGDIRIGREKPVRGIKKGTKLTCPYCGKRVRKAWMCEDGHTIEHKLDLCREQAIEEYDSEAVDIWDTIEQQGQASIEFQEGYQD